MFTRIDDFEACWKTESEGTLRVLGALTDASLGQATAAQSRTLGRIAWHLTVTIPEMMGRTGLALSGPEEEAPVPARAADIVEAYAGASRALMEAIRSSWTDDSLEESDDMYGQRWKRGATLLALVSHQAHHRGQMTVLMRQAGLRVPGVYGPAREDWSTMGMEPPAV
jgi:uncharacterized damage-inducible protein DinB